MANTYKALATVTVGGGGAASIDFTNIPATYTDLQIVVSARNTSTPQNIIFRINNISTSIYAFKNLYGFGTAAGSGGTLTDTSFAPVINPSTSTANTYSNVSIYIPNYASQSQKSLSMDDVFETNSSGNTLDMTAGLWQSTANVTSINMTLSSGSFAQYSTATLYGVFNADVSSAPATPTIGTATAGAQQASITFTGVSNAASYTMTSTPGNITATGTSSPIVVTGLTAGTAYTFKVKANNPFGSSAESAASNSVTPTNPIVAEIVTIAGGGAGGGSRGGGGGAGGLVYTSSITLTGTCTVTVGAGGSAVAGNTGQSGSNSTFTATTNAIGGGGGGVAQVSGGSTTPSNGLNGGSGGGAASNIFVAAGSVGVGTSGQGKNGGPSYITAETYSGGGGGGFGVAGGAGASLYAGRGGNGTNAYSAWGIAGGVGQSIIGVRWFAGGGGGGSYYEFGTSDNPALGGNGGGGEGGARPGGTAGTGTGKNGTANTGGGGGGNGTASTAGAGGSGIVMLRYADSLPAASSTTGSPNTVVTGGYRYYFFTGSGSITF